MEFTDVIRDRYSCKSYDGRKVEPEKLEGVAAGTTISVNGNTLIINGQTITATAASASGNTSYSFSSWSIPSATITGDTAITANFEKSVASDFPWWILAAIAALAALLIILLFLFRGKGKSVVLSTSDSSYSSVSSRSFDGKTLQFLELAVGEEMAPVYSYVRNKDSFNRYDYLFYAKNLPAGLFIDENGTLRGTLSEPKNVGYVGTFYIVAVKKPDSGDSSENKNIEDQKSVCSTEFKFVVKA